MLNNTGQDRYPHFFGEELLDEPHKGLEMIGGIKAKKKFYQILEFSNNKHNAVQMFSIGIRPEIGLLLYGEPGNGKSLLTKKMAWEFGMKNAEPVHIRCYKGSDYTTNYQGDQAKRVHIIFNELKSIVIRDKSIVIAIFDEIDLLAPKKGKAGIVSSARSNTILQEIDGIIDNPIFLGKIIIFGTTNHPTSISEPLVRSERLRICKVPKPNRQNRKKLAIFYLDKLVLSTGPHKKILDMIDVAIIADLTTGYNGSDFARLQRDLFYLIKDIEEKVKQVTPDDILKTIRHSISSTENTLKEIAKFDEEYKNIVKGRHPEITDEELRNILDNDNDDERI